jgi:Lrp/AsnC family leucine-responsive transcriptional regulator
MMDSSKHYKNLITKVEKMPTILECHTVIGESSHLLKALVKITEALERVLSEMQSWQEVTGTKTTYVLTSVKKTFEINV